MKKHTSVFFTIILLCFVWVAQAQEYTIQWDEVKILDHAKTKKRLAFQYAIYDKDNFALYHLSVPGRAMENVVIIPLETVPLNNAEKFFIPSTAQPTTSQVSFYRGIPTTLVMFSPVIIGAGGRIDKIIRFKLQYQDANIRQEPRILKSSNSSFSRSARTAETNASVLASGTWYKFPVAKDGIYKIDYAYLESLGINPKDINPGQIRLFGNGGGMLPQLNSATHYDDLVENAIRIVGDQDGSFDKEDYILFYAKSPHSWTFDAVTNLFEYTHNLYSDVVYYFLNVGTANGIRVSSKNSLGSALHSFNYFDDRQAHEKDLTNILKSGREWYGEKFNTVTPSHAISFDWAGARSGSQIRTDVTVLGRSFVSTSFTVLFNRQSAGNLSVPVMPSYPLHPEGVNVAGFFPTNVSSLAPFDKANVEIIFNNGSTFSSEAYLNKVTIQGQRVLRCYENQTNFRCKASIDQLTTEYRIQGGGGISVWDVTDHVNPIAVNYDLQGGEIVFSDQSDVLREYICFRGTSFPSPASGVRVPNQNLHAVDAPYLPDMVIVTHPGLKPQADLLAQHRKMKDNLDVLVVTIDQVYNEFSSGTQDITAIRNFMKMLYDRSTATDSLRYLLLFGDCSYDYKNRIPNNTNLVPCYQSRNSLDPVRSYSSEDYFGFMDDTEGNWGEVFGAEESHLIDIFVARIPAQNPEQAAAIVNKIIYYQSAAPSQGKWKNRIAFVADDADYNAHFEDAELMATTVANNDARYNLNKIYIDAYPQETGAGGEKSPIVKSLIDKEIEKGVFVLNYNGHGGTNSWAQEQILNLAQIDAWQNYNALPLVVTATCDFGLYDDPYIRSGADALLFNPTGGAIGVITAARVVYQYSNRNLNRNLYQVLFNSYGTDILPRIGDVMKLTKNNSSTGVNNRNYVYMGDPSMKLAYPNKKVAVTVINGNPVSAIADTLKALSKVTIEGEVRNQNNSLAAGYNGIALVTCFDKENTLFTLGSANDVEPFNVRNNFFFEGKASVVNGKFKVTFVVPKDISYLFDQGKISIYTLSQGGVNDGGGYYENIQVGGSNVNAAPDNIPPIIELFMNDESFVSGGLTNNNPLFIAKVSDENGINVGTGGVGHEITTIVSNRPEVLVLNEYYSTELNDYTKGAVRYPMKSLTSGNYALRFKVWDTYNNSSEAYLEFVVANTEKIALDHLLNYPNPFSTRTDFHFDHNRAGDDIEVLIQVYTVSGKMIKSMDQVFYMSPAHVSGLVWDGRDDFGDKIGKGVYVYKVKVRSLRDGSTVHQFQKLVLLN